MPVVLACTPCRLSNTGRCPCRRSALALADGSILVLHGAAVLRWGDHAVEVAGGGFTGGTSLLPGPDGEAWVFDYTTADAASTPCSPPRSAGANPCILYRERSH
jgi:hypothetical protein